MTQEEKIKRLKALKARCERLIVSSDRGPEEWRKDAEAIDLALAALRGPTREMVERMFPGCPGCDSVTSKWEIKFCPFCGKPRTDEAVDMMLERWKEAVDGETD